MRTKNLSCGRHMACASTFVLLGLVFLTASAWAQTDPGRGPGPQGEAAGPDQPVRPRIPVLVPRAAEPSARQAPAPPQPPRPPFMLTPQEEVQVERRTETMGGAEPRDQDVRLPVQAVDLRRGVRHA